MPGKAKATDEEKVATVDLVSPDGEITKKGIEVDSAQDIALRFDGYLPADQQKLEAPERPKGEAPKTAEGGA